MKINFEEFLADKHIADCPQVLDDDLSEDFDRWLVELEQDDLIKYGQEYADKIQDKTKAIILQYRNEQENICSESEDCNPIACVHREISHSLEEVLSKLK